MPILKFILTLVGCLCGKRATRLNEIQSPEQFRAVIDREMSRADRCRSHFSLVAFEFAPANREQAHSHMQRLLSDIHNRIRCTDYAGWMGEDELGMLIIDCSTEQVNQLATALSAEFEAAIGTLRYQIETYPIAPSTQIISASAESDERSPISSETMPA